MTPKRSILALCATLLLATHGRARACPAEPYLGSVCLTAANYCPMYYAEAAGQTLQISQYSALYAVMGTQYGGNGTTTFNLPDLRGRVPLGVGTGAGLTPVSQGATGGSETVTLTVAHLPSHGHAAALNGTSANGDVDGPAGAVPARLPRSRVYASGAADVAMGASAISVSTTGSGQPAPVRDPWLGLRYCIALEGIFPPRS